ncbi:uncharacterized protein LOC144703153 [Wolffia australiana]
MFGFPPKVTRSDRGSAAMARQQMFIALRCFDCDTMQVKQQKRSSNKWICAVCNQKQSVKKVFARSGLAKDVRGFVQRFNMARSSAERNDPSFSSPDHQGGSDVRSDHVEEEDLCPVPRTDWSQFLDPVEGEDPPDDDSCADLFFVTEMPPRKANKRTATSKIQSDRSTPREDEPPRRNLFRIEQNRSKQHSDSSSARQVFYSSTGSGEKRRCLPLRPSSKWGEYLQEDASSEVFENGCTSPSERAGFNEGVHCELLESAFEEEVHPDFL